MSGDTWTGRTGGTGGRSPRGTKRMWRRTEQKPSQTTKRKDSKDDDPKSGGPKEAKESTSTLCGDTGKRDGGGGEGHVISIYSS